jgi:hypothetical protein
MKRLIQTAWQRALQCLAVFVAYQFCLAASCDAGAYKKHGPESLALLARFNRLLRVPLHLTPFLA